MKIIESISEMQAISTALRKDDKTIAVVPTMGYFHEGHISLMQLGRESADVVISTLFVNPTQFAPDEDFEKYPRDFDSDCKTAEENGTDYLFHPPVDEMYPLGYISEIRIGGIAQKFEGVTRPFHFNGVATVVSKLFNATLPDIAIFGQKDYQQAAVIKQMVRDLNFPVKIIVAPTKREADGLAMSSRNVYLSSEFRKQAPVLYKALETAKKAIEKGERNTKAINNILHKTLMSKPDIKIDYACAADALTLEEPEVFTDGQQIVLLIACYLGRTRLIDNCQIP
ncbi:pantoate--beta-alanine ligase [Bacteroidota bacterium]